MATPTEIRTALNTAIAALANLKLRIVEDPEYLTKGSELEWTELDGNQKLNADQLRNALEQALEIVNYSEDTSKVIGTPFQIAAAIPNTYSALTHRNGIRYFDTTSEEIDFTFPAGLTKYDNFFLDNETGENNINLLTGAGDIINREDGLVIDAIGPGGWGWVQKNESGLDFKIRGKNLITTVAFAAVPGYPDVINEGTMGASEVSSFNKNFNYWYMGVDSGDPDPSIAAIKAGGGLYSANGSGLALEVKQSNFSGVMPEQDVKHAWVAETTNASEQLTGIVNWTAQAAPAPNNIAVRSAQVFTGTDATFAAGFSFNLDMGPDSVLYIERIYQANSAKYTNGCTIGGNAATKIVNGRTSQSFPNFGQGFMMTKAMAPANGLVNVVWSTDVDNVITYVSQRVVVYILDGVEQSVLDPTQVKQFSGGGVENHLHTLTGLPENYFLLQVANARDNNNAYDLTVPVEQTSQLKYRNDFLESITSYKSGTTAANSMEIDTGNPLTARLIHNVLAFYPV